MANVSHTRSVASTHPSHQGDQSAPSPRQSEAMRVRQARARPSSQWRLGAIPLAPLGQAISRGLRAMSCFVRPHRVNPSAVAADAFKTTAGKTTAAGVSNKVVVVHDQKAAYSKGSKPACRTGFDEELVSPTATTQMKVAKSFGLPTSFTELRPSRLMESSELTKSAIGVARLDWEPSFLTVVDSAHLDAFLSYCATQDFSAENPLFVIAAQKLFRTAERSEERATLARGMQQAFTDEHAQLEPNFEGTIKRQLQAALAGVARGETPDNLRPVLEAAQKNLLKSFGTDAFGRFLKSLPA